MATRRTRLLAAGAFLVGCAVFVAGLAVELTASWYVGSILIFLGGVLMRGSRFAVRGPSPSPARAVTPMPRGNLSGLFEGSDKFRDSQTQLGGSILALSG